jgi:molecular chaperone DnaK
MDEAEVDRLRKEAEKFAEQDKEKKEQVQVRNDLDSMVYQCEKQLEDLGGKAPGDLKAKVDGLLSDAKKVLEKEDASLAELKEVKESLQKSFEEIAKAGPMPGASPDGPDPEAGSDEANDETEKEDDIVDADFEVVDDEKDKT